MTGQQRNELDSRGYVVLERYLSPELLTQVQDRVEELYTQEGENAGAEFRKEPGARRLANLVDKGPIFETLVAMPEVLELVGHVLNNDFKLSSFNARSTDPFCPDAQPLHCDAGALPDERGYTVCNTIWLLDDFTPQNGATRVIPGSQNWKQLPQNALKEPAAPHPEEELVLGPAGSVVVMNTHAWHGGTANLTNSHRRALHIFYCRNDKPQQQYQKKLLRPETQSHLAPEVRRILALDDPLNDQMSSVSSGASGFLK
jgi:ectoine hydroxylase-related dioxygenase (phytanoyl-CoA dioxygenase family)